MTKILIIDDEAQIRKLLSRIISLEGYEVLQADSIKNGVKQIKQHQPDIVLCDVFLPDGNGVSAIPELKSVLVDGEIIMLTAHGNITDGVQSIQSGAYNYLTKGDDNDRIIPMLANAADKVAQRKRLIKLESLIKKDYSFDSIIGKSKTILLSVEMAKKVAPTEATIMLTGETGTGKEVFASAIHHASTRAKGSFVAVNCGALSGELIESEMFGYKAGAFTGATKDKKGLFEQADKGTIFLDEVGEMPPTLQTKLLRALETGEFIPVGDTKTTRVDVRVITATNRNLKAMVETGAFREDLFYRLSVFAIELPPLRERGDDVVLLAQTFINGFAAKMNITINDVEELFFEAIKNYAWKGNIRELRNVMERSIILSSDGVLKLNDLPVDIQVSQGSTIDWVELAAVEKAHICRMLQYTGGNKTEAARLMKIGLTTLYRKIEEYNLATQ